MRFFWFMLFLVGAIIIKENLCVPAIRPLSQRGILFPVDNWDNCFLDVAESQPGICKKLEDCPEVLKKWDKENIYPKTCYFIKKQQFVCCPIVTSKVTATASEKPENINIANPTKKPENIFSDIFNTNAVSFTTKPENKNAGTTTIRPSNIFLNNIQSSTSTTSTQKLEDIIFDIFNTDRGIFATKAENKNSVKTTKRTLNIFLDNIQTSTTTSTKRPFNIFLDNWNTDKSTSQKPPFPIPDTNNTEKPLFLKRRSEIECDLENPQKFETIKINGTPAEPNEFPFMAVLGLKYNGDENIWYPCGGVLISSKFVLTAAHCAEIGGENPLLVRLGDKKLTDLQEDTIKVKRVIVHPNYNATAFQNDLALVELEREVNNPRACLWTQHHLPIIKLTALGYGQTRFDSIDAHTLFTASLNAIDKSDCQNYYKTDKRLKDVEIFDSHLCAGDIDNFHNLCQGDTGGPLIIELSKVSYVVGISSYGLGCADLPPSLYTRTSSFIDWIESIIWPEIDIRIDRK